MGDLKYIGECAWVLCKYHTIVYKRLEHAHILVSVGDPKINHPSISRGDYILITDVESYSYIPSTWLYPNKLQCLLLHVRIIVFPIAFQ